MSVIIGLILFSGIYSWFIEPAWLAIREYKVRVGKDKLQTSLRVLFISDVHCGFWETPWVNYWNLYRLRRHCAAHPVDLILFGGDYIDRQPRFLDRLEKILRRFQKYDLPMYAVLGNHDYSSFSNNPEILEQLLEKCNIKVLKNATEKVTISGQSLALIGLNDLQQSPVYQPTPETLRPEEYGLTSKNVKWLQAADTAPQGMVRIVISHNPDAIHLPSLYPPNLILAGHTHGGQLIPLLWWGKYVYKIMPPGTFVGAAGKWVRGTTTLIISRGFAGSLIPARFLCRPEAVIVTLSPNK